MKASNVCTRNRTRVRILNPAPGGQSYTSEAQALRYVTAGRAEWCGQSIRFFEQTHQQRAVIATALEYDRIRRVMTPKELRALPMVGDVNRMYR